MLAVMAAYYVGARNLKSGSHAWEESPLPFPVSHQLAAQFHHFLKDEQG